MSGNLQAPTFNIQTNTKLQTSTGVSAQLVVSFWCMMRSDWFLWFLELLWSLDVGPWMFSPRSPQKRALSSGETALIIGPCKAHSTSLERTEESLGSFPRPLGLPNELRPLPRPAGQAGHCQASSIRTKPYIAPMSSASGGGAGFLPGIPARSPNPAITSRSRWIRIPSLSSAAKMERFVASTMFAGIAAH